MSGCICIQIIHINADNKNRRKSIHIRFKNGELLQSPFFLRFLKRNLLAPCVRNRVLADPPFINRMLRRLETDVTTDAPPIRKVLRRSVHRVHREDDDIPHLKVGCFPFTTVFIADLYRIASEMTRCTVLINICSAVGIPNPCETR